MSSFWLNKHQRQWLIDQYIEQLEEFDQLEEFPDMAEHLAKLKNPDLINECVEFMPLIMQFMPKKF